MEKSKKIIAITGVFIFLFSYGNMSGNINPDPQDSKPAKTQTKSTQTTKKTTQTKSKSAQTKPKSTPKSTTSEPVNKPKDTENYYDRYAILGNCKPECKHLPEWRFNS